MKNDLIHKFHAMVDEVLGEVTQEMAIFLFGDRAENPEEMFAQHRRYFENMQERLDNLIVVLEARNDASKQYSDYGRIQRLREKLNQYFEEWSGIVYRLV